VEVTGHRIKMVHGRGKKWAMVPGYVQPLEFEGNGGKTDRRCLEGGEKRGKTPALQKKRRGEGCQTRGLESVPARKVRVPGTINEAFSGRGGRRGGRKKKKWECKQWKLKGEGTFVTKSICGRMGSTRKGIERVNKVREEIKSPDRVIFLGKEGREPAADHQRRSSPQIKQKTCLRERGEGGGLFRVRREPHKEQWQDDPL